MAGFRLLKDGKIVPVHQEPFDNHGTVVYQTRSEVGYAGQVFPVVGSVLEQEILDGEHEGTWEIVEDEPDLEPETEVSQDAHLHGEDVHEHRTDYEDMKPDDLMVLTRDHDLTVEGTGAGGNVLKKDYVAALVAIHEALDPDPQGSGQ